MHHPTRDAAYQQRLLQHIAHRYALNITGISPAKRGFFGETWHVESNSGPFFAKLDRTTEHQSIYRLSLPAVAHLRAWGIQHIGGVIPTEGGALWTPFEGGTLALFEYVPGENTEDYPLERLFHALAPIYKVPIDVLSLPRERFGLDTFEAFVQSEALLRKGPMDTPAHSVLATLAIHREPLHHHANRLHIVSGLCQGKPDFLVLTHGDAGRNAIIEDQRFTLIDWDQV